MKTYQIQIEVEFFTELKRVLAFLPKNSVKLQTQTGYEISLDSNPSDFELSDEFDAFIEEGIAELDRGEGIPHDQMVAEMQAKYPNLTFRK